ncbi:hypothetical protein VNO78_22193 [Psophocarpus tetragonolobus]|uniref:C2H2-type domain-containing protein n=1 Tax=Psophocarpus tetragonolobus TaxID=3891 RepID=A0AAN9SEI6_PSOTE
MGYVHLKIIPTNKRLSGIPSHSSTFEERSTEKTSEFSQSYTSQTNIGFVLYCMKRQRDGVESINLANCLMLLSHPRESKPQKCMGPIEFECRTCNRKFPSFQALGGHRASHKKPKLDVEQHSKIGPKRHECYICGQKFSSGQAMGGHMKRHRITANMEGLSSIKQVVANGPVLKKSNSKRVFFLDLNLTPLQNDLKLLFGDKAPKVDS